MAGPRSLAKMSSFDFAATVAVGWSGYVGAFVAHVTGWQLPAEWATVASLNDYALRVRPEEARALVAELNAVLQRWMDAHPSDRADDDGELVSVLLDVVPLKEWPA